MSAYLLDTNVVSELRRSRPDGAVSAWYDAIAGDDVYLSVLVVGEIRNGIDRLAARDPDQAGVLAEWLSVLRTSFADRILPVDVDTAERWGRLEAVRPLPVPDGLMAATALVHDLTFATRNVRDVEGTGARLVNPWDHA